MIRFQRVRKWSTKLLSLLIGLNFALLPGDDPARSHEAGMEIGEYAIRLAIRQLADPSRKVVKQAAKLLFTWLPVSLATGT